MTGTLLLGLITGLTLGLLSMGLVFVYQAARFINLAHAQLGVLGAVLLGKFVIDHGVPYWIAFPLAIAVGAGVGVLSERYVIRRIKSRSPISLLLTSLGLAQVLLAATYLKSVNPNPAKLQASGYPIPFSSIQIGIGGFIIRGQHVLILVLAPLLAAALAAFLRYTSLGKSIRAVASNRDAARLAGISVSRVNAVTWGIAGALSAVTAVLLAPAQSSFNGFTLGPGLLLRALGGAALGGFVSLPAAMIGGIGLGLLEHLALHMFNDSGIAELVIFVAVAGIILIRGRAIAEGSSRESGSGDEESVFTPSPRLARRPLVRFQRAWLALFGLAVGIVLPLLPIFRTEASRFQLALIVVFAILGVSLTILIGWAGTVSLGHFAVLGIGAYTTFRMAPDGASLPLIMVVAGLSGALAMFLLALPVSRARNPMAIAATTLGFAVVAPQWLYRQPWFGAKGNALVLPPTFIRGLGVPRTQLAAYYLALAVLALTIAVVAQLRRSGPGRLIIAVRDNPSAATTLGYNPAGARLTVAAVSGFIAAVAGVMWVLAWHNVSADLFPPETSLAMVAVPVIGGIGSIPGAVIGSVAVFAPSLMAADFFRTVFGNDVGVSLLISGVGLLGTQLARPRGIASAVRGAWEKFLKNLEKALPPERGEQTSELCLVVENLHVNFGGIAAVDGVSLEIRPGEIVGLIGTNGAGKSTLLNAVSGMCPSEGSVRIFGEDVGSLPAEYRAHAGLARSHQDARLFPGLTVREAVQVAVGKSRRLSYVAAMTAVPWARMTEARSKSAADALLERFGLTAWANTLTSELSTGTRRICDLALQVAANPKVLLLDEPTAGVAQREAEAFAPLIKSLRDELGCAILIVEHDMPLIMGIADRIYAMEAGRVIAEGTPDEVRHNPLVVASYLGSDPDAIERSGSSSRKRAAAPKAARRRPAKAGASTTRKSSS